MRGVRRFNKHPGCPLSDQQSHYAIREINLYRATCQIVVIEDNPLNSRLLKHQLAHLGFDHVEVFDQATEALAWVKDHPCTLILTDCQMRPMSGFDFTRALRAHEAQFTQGQHIKVIAVTAGAMPADLQHCLESGMDDYLIKPVLIDPLRQMLDKWLCHAPVTQHASTSD